MKPAANTPPRESWRDRQSRLLVQSAQQRQALQLSCAELAGQWHWLGRFTHGKGRWAALGALGTALVALWRVGPIRTARWGSVAWQVWRLWRQWRKGH